jgi:hypothetical protein
MPRPSELRALERMVESDSLDDALDDLSAGELDNEGREAVLQSEIRAAAHRPLDIDERARIVRTLSPRRSIAAAPMVVIALAAAAALVFWLVPHRDPSLPAYALELEAAARSRGSSDTILARGARIEIRLRPAREVTQSVHAALYVREGDRITQLAVRPEVAPSGAVRFSGLAGEGAWRLPAGRSTLIAIVSSGELPDANEIDALEAHESRRRFELPIDLR